MSLPYKTIPLTADKVNKKIDYITKNISTQIIAQR